jgi:hypothetical protein
MLLVYMNRGRKLLASCGVEHPDDASGVIISEL